MQESKQKKLSNLEEYKRIKVRDLAIMRFINKGSQMVNDKNM